MVFAFFWPQNESAKFNLLNRKFAESVPYCQKLRERERAKIIKKTRWLVLMVLNCKKFLTWDQYGYIGAGLELWFLMGLSLSCTYIAEKCPVGCCGERES